VTFVLMVLPQSVSTGSEMLHRGSAFRSASVFRALNLEYKGTLGTQAISIKQDTNGDGVITAAEQLMTPW
jgi:hypothetical protein